MRRLPAKAIERVGGKLAAEYEGWARQKVGTSWFGIKVKEAPGSIRWEKPRSRVNLSVKVAQHFVGAPSVDEADDVGIDTCVEESIGGRHPQTAGSNIIGKQAQEGTQKLNRQLDGLSDEFGDYIGGNGECEARS